MYIIFLFLLSFFSQTLSQFTIMLDPSGDAQHTGRIIDNMFERGISLQCAEYLKKEINQKYQHIRVIISRIPGEIVEPLQNASFANKLQIDAYISLYFYQTKQVPMHIYFFYKSKHPETDMWHQPKQLSWYNVDDIYLMHFKQSKKYAEIFYNNFANKEYAQYIKPHSPIGIPLTQLKGINAPSILLEMSLQTKNDWKMMIQPFLHSIGSLINEI